MHPHAFTSLAYKKIHFPIFHLRPVEQSKLTSQPPLTRARYKKAMKQIKQNQAALKDDIDSMKGNIDEVKGSVEKV